MVWGGEIRQMLLFQELGVLGMLWGWLTGMPIPTSWLFSPWPLVPAKSHPARADPIPGSFTRRPVAAILM